MLAGSVSEYYVRGGHIDWRGWDEPWQRQRLMLPTYPFQRSRQWFELDPSRRRMFGGDGDGAPAMLHVSARTRIRCSGRSSRQFGRTRFSKRG